MCIYIFYWYRDRERDVSFVPVSRFVNNPWYGTCTVLRTTPGYYSSPVPVFCTTTATTSANYCCHYYYCYHHYYYYCYHHYYYYYYYYYYCLRLATQSQYIHAGCRFLAIHEDPSKDVKWFVTSLLRTCRVYTDQLSQPCGQCDKYKDVSVQCNA